MSDSPITRSKLLHLATLIIFFSLASAVSADQIRNLNRTEGISCAPCLSVGSEIQSEKGEKMSNPSKDEVIKRALCIYALVARGEFESTIQDVPHPTVKELHTEKIRDLNKWITSQGLAKFQSKEEKLSFKKPPGSWSKQEIINASWRTESLGILLWALSLIDTVPPYDREFNQEWVLSKVNAKELKKFCSLAKLRKREEINRERDKAELWHWRFRTTQIMQEGVKPPAGTTFDDILKQASTYAVKQGSIPSSMENDFSLFGKAYRHLHEKEYQHAGSIARERHFVLNWLSGYSEDWDETPTDT
jgi:hypothetical protein